MPANTLCTYPTCVALAEIDRHYCPVHRPEAVVKRVQKIITKHLGETQDLELQQLRKALLRDLENTI